MGLLSKLREKGAEYISKAGDKLYGAKERLKNTSSLEAATLGASAAAAAEVVYSPAILNLLTAGEYLVLHGAANTIGVGAAALGAIGVKKLYDRATGKSGREALLKPYKDGINVAEKDLKQKMGNLKKMMESHKDDAELLKGLRKEFQTVSESYKLLEGNLKSYKEGRTDDVVVLKRNGRTGLIDADLKPDRIYAPQAKQNELLGKAREIQSYLKGVTQNYHTGKYYAVKNGIKFEEDASKVKKAKNDLEKIKKEFKGIDKLKKEVYTDDERKLGWTKKR